MVEQEVKIIGEQEERGLLNPTQDVVFQALFGTKGSEEILAAFLTSILGEKVDNVSLDANQNLVRESPNKKLGVLDLVANVGDKTTVHIEVQMVNPRNMFKRLLWYWSRIYGKQLKVKGNYLTLKKTITILIVNYDIREFKWFKDAHTVWNLREERNPRIHPFEDLQIHVIELPKIKKYQEATEKELNNWLEFLSDPESEVVKLSKEKDEDLRKAYEKLEYISGDDDLRREADLRLMAILDENSRKEWAEEQEKKAKENAKKAKKYEKKAKEYEQQAQKFKQKAKQEEQKAKEQEQKAKEQEQKAKQQEIRAQNAEKALEDTKKALENSKSDSKKAIVKRMLAKKVNIKDIIELIGITEKELEEIQKEN